MPTPSARDAMKTELDKMATLLDALRAKLDHERECLDTNATLNWGNVGDITHLNHGLRELVAFTRNCDADDLDLGR